MAGAGAMGIHRCDPQDLGREVRQKGLAPTLRGRRDPGRRACGPGRRNEVGTNTPTKVRWHAEHRTTRAGMAGRGLTSPRDDRHQITDGMWIRPLTAGYDEAQVP